MMRWRGILMTLAAAGAMVAGSWKEPKAPQAPAASRDVRQALETFEECAAGKLGPLGFEKEGEMKTSFAPGKGNMSAYLRFKRTKETKPGVTRGDHVSIRFKNQGSGPYAEIVATTETVFSRDAISGGTGDVPKARKVVIANGSEGVHLNTLGASSAWSNAGGPSGEAKVASQAVEECAGPLLAGLTDNKRQQPRFFIPNQN